MKITYKMGFLFLFSVFLISGLYAGDDKDKVRQKIEETNKQMSEDMISGNYQACVDLYTDDAISMPSYAKMNRGKAAIEEHMKKEGDMGKITDIKFETLEVLGENDMFVEIGTYNITLDMKDMEEPFTDVGKYLTVWKQMPDGSLKIQSDIWNTDINYMENQMAGEKNSPDDEMTGGKKKD